MSTIHTTSNQQPPANGSSAMQTTIPTTFKNTKIPYTVICGQKKATGGAGKFSLLLLNRSGRPFRTSVLKEFGRLQFEELISVEGPVPSNEVETLSRQFPATRFVLLHDEASIGEKINIGIEEAVGEYVFVVWDDLKVAGGTVSSRLLERIRESKVLCTVPLLQNLKNETVPSVLSPAFFRRRLKIVPLMPSADKLPTIAPFDYLGIYNKDQFLLVGGFDSSMKNPYWQKLDFGFRSFMWGFRLHCNTSLRLHYQRDMETENATPDNDYKMFFLKNLSIKFSGDSGLLPVGQFLPYYFRSGGGIFSALRDFKRVRKWVQLNTYRFVQDARRITELWETPTT